MRFENDKIVEIKGIQVYSDITSVQELKFDSRDTRVYNNTSWRA